MANPTDNLPGFAVQGLPSTMAPIPQVQPAARLAPQAPVPVQPPVVVPPSGFVARGPTPYGVPGQVPPAMQPPAQAVGQATPANQPLDTAALNAATQGAPAQTAAQPVPDVSAAQQTQGTPTHVAIQPATIPTFGGAPASGVDVYRGMNGPAAGGSGQVGAFRDPSGAISAGFQAQQAYGDHFMNQALDYINGGANIWEQATRGRAIGNILHAVAGQNNQGAVQGQGADALNQSIAGLSGASLGAQASMYGANMGYNANADRVGEQRYQTNADLRARTVQIGQTMSYDPSTGMQQIVGNYAQPQVGAGGMVTLQPISPPTRQAAAPKPVVGATYRDAKGNLATYQQDGTYKAVTQ